MTLPGDNPIEKPEDDALGRIEGAKSFARHVLSLDAGKGVLVGVLGAWGSGKTSFVNLAMAELENSGAILLDFNPWMFSGTEQLVESFFVELAAQLKVKPGLAQVGKDLEDYGETFAGLSWLPLVGPWIERGRGATKLLGKLLQRRKEGIGGRRQKLQKALIALDKPIIIVLDDIDRLSSPEIRDVFRLVRLTASFPNVIYIVAFDRIRVEQALSEQGNISGREYLEKILQIAVDLPAIPEQVLNRQLFSALDAAIQGLDTTPLNDQIWPDIFFEIVWPLIRHMRDVRRYAAGLRGTVQDTGDGVALADVLALEAVRIFLPDVFSRLHGTVGALTTPWSTPLGGRSEEADLKAQIDRLLEAGKPHDDVVRNMIERLFPAAQRFTSGSRYDESWTNGWLIDRRVAHEAVLRLYLERVPGERLLAFGAAELAFARMADADELDNYLRSLDQDRVEDVIASLEAYEGDFSKEHVVPGIVALLNLLPDLPERERGLFSIETRLVVTRVVYRLLRSLRDPSAVEAAVREILPRLQSLSAKLEVILDIGYQEGAGHKLVSQEAATELEHGLRDEIRAANVGDLTKESRLLRLLLFARQAAEPSEEQLTIDPSPALTLAILRDARSDAIGQSMGVGQFAGHPGLLGMR